MTRVACFINADGKEEALFDGRGIEVDSKATIRPGDKYLAPWGTPRLLTCKEVVHPNCSYGVGWLVPNEESGFRHDIRECVKVVDPDDKKKSKVEVRWGHFETGVMIAVALFCFIAFFYGFTHLGDMK